jgi:hypothetical protein
MAITNSQNTKMYLVAVGAITTGADDIPTAAEIETAIGSAKEIDCLLDLGDLNLGTRSVQEYTCINKKVTSKSFGSYSYGNITPSLLFDATDTTGQKDLKDMWKNEERRVVIIALDDQITDTTGNPTYFTFEAGVSSPTVGIAKDNAVMYNPTIEICSVVNETEAS